VEALLRESPTASLAEIARQCGVSRQYVHNLRKGLENASVNSSTGPSTTPDERQQVDAS
jgi:DNA-binding IclR family transcriptional regulator